MKLKLNGTLKQTVGLFFSGLSAFLFGTMTSVRLSNFFILGPAHYFLFSSFVLLNAINIMLDMHRVWIAKNKNIDAVSMLVVDLLVAGIMSIAVIGGFVLSAVFSLATPILFTAGMGLHALYSLTKTIYCGIKWATTQDPESRQRFKSEFFGHGTGALIGIAGAVCVGLLMVFHVAPFIMAIANIVVNSVAFVLGVTALIKQHRAAIAKEANPVAAPAPEPAAALLREVLVAKPENYFQRRPQPNTTAQLLDMINEKQVTLGGEIRRDERALFSPQLSKRKAKMDALTKLSTLVANNEATTDDLRNLKAGLKLEGNQQKISQSFFRERSDTQSLFDVAKEHLAARAAPAA